MSILQSAVETFEERKVRLQRATGCAKREQSLFKQHFVQANIILQYHQFSINFTCIMLYVCYLINPRSDSPHTMFNIH